MFKKDKKLNGLVNKIVTIKQLIKAYETGKVFTVEDFKKCGEDSKEIMLAISEMRNYNN